MFGLGLVQAESPKVSLTEAQATPRPTISDTALREFKDKIANKVAELQKGSQKVIAGYVTKVSSGSATIDVSKTEFDITFDPSLVKVYVFSAGTKKESTVEKLAKDDYIAAFGSIIGSGVVANTILVDEPYQILSGRITEVDTDDNSIKFFTFDKSNYTLDVQVGSKLNMMNIKTLEPEKTGMSKLKEGDVAQITIRRKLNANPPIRADIIKAVIVPQEYFNK